MWSPTHIQVTVQRAKGLLTKGKNETNNCFVTIGLGKEKYQTSVKEKSEPNVSWNEECELKIPDQGNKAELVLTCLHRNNLGIDEFLGQAILPLNEMDVYDRPRSKWFKLQSKPGKEKKNKDRGELEVRINFVVKSGSLTDLSKKEKHKSSIGQLASSVGGSLLSIGTLEKRKGIKKFAKSLGSKMHLHSKKKNKEGDDLSYNGSIVSIDAGINSSYNSTPRYGQRAGEADPGVISEDEDEFVFDKLSHKSSGSSLNVRANMRNTESQKFVASNSSSLINAPDNRWSKGKQSDENQINENEYRESKSSNEIELENDQLLLPPPSNIISALHEDNDKVKNTSNLNSFNHAKIFNEMKKEPIITNEPDKLFLASNKTRYEFDLKSQTESNLPEKPENEFPLVLNETIDKENNFKESENIQYETNTNIIKSTEPSPKLYVDEWESKLYLDINKSDSLKRNTWQAARVQIPVIPKSESSERRQSTSSDTDTEEEVQIIEKKFNNNKSNTLVDEKLKNEDLVMIDLKDLEECEQQATRNDNYEQFQIKNVSLQNVQDSERNKLHFGNEDNIQKTSIVNEFKDLKPYNESIKTSLSQKIALQPTTQRIGKFPEKQNRFVEGEFRRSPNERIIIGHEKSKEERNSDLAAMLEKKYEGKTREELMFIANGMENEVFKYRQRVKELEDYLDNLLLRVMETHPKILQNPYSRTTSAKSG